MSSALKTTLAAAGISVLAAGASAQGLPNIPAPTVEAGDLGFRVILVHDFLKSMNDRSVPVSYDGQVQQVQAAPRSLEDIDFIFQDKAAGVICESTLMRIANANRPYSAVDCGESRDPLRQFTGGEKLSATQYFDAVSRVSDIVGYDAVEQSQSVLETIAMVKGEFSFTLQRQWKFTEDNVSVCVNGQMWMEGYDEAIAEADEICNDDVPASDYLADIFFEYEEELGPIIMPDFYDNGPSSF